MNPSTCPHISRLLDSFPRATFRSVATVDNVPTLLTGAYPHEHGVWGPRLRSERDGRGRAARLVDLFPDLVTTTVQGLVHLFTPVELATMPPRRRRRFEIMRFKFIKTRQGSKVTLPINQMPSIFTVVGPDRSRFRFHGGFRALRRLLTPAGEDDVRLEMVEIHGLDKVQHWYLDDEAEIARRYRVVDELVAQLQQESARRERALLFLCDHGMEPVAHNVDLMADLDSLGLATGECDYFIENTRATFWTHTDEAAARILALLKGIPHGQIVSREDLARYNIHFPDRAYGDLYFYARPGCAFFPNDFYHPLANFVLGCLDAHQRARLRDPCHRGDHGYLPEAPSERGYMILVDDRFAVAAEEARLIDVAPSVLALLGLEPAGTMRGRPVFHRKPSVG